MQPSQFCLLLPLWLWFTTALALDIGAYRYADVPMPMVEINGRQDQILLYPGQPFDIQLRLEAGDAAGQSANWWIVAAMNGQFIHLNLPDATTLTTGSGQIGWESGLQAAFRAPLGDFEQTLLQNLVLPPGEYDLYFGVDTDANQPLHQFNPQTLRFSRIHVSIPNSGQRIYSVSPQGNDANPGTLEQPWQTLGAAAERATAGDLVWVRAGTYREQLVPKNSGEAGRPLIFAAFPEEEVVLSGKKLNLATKVAPGTPFDGVIHLHGLQHVWISGFSVQDTPDIGIMGYECEDLVIQDNTVTDSASSGIAVWKSSQVIVDGNEINRANQSKEQENLSIGENVTDFEIRYNHVHHSATTGKGGEGIDIKDGSGNGSIHHNHVHDIPRKLCLYVDAWDTLSENLDIYANRLHDCNPHGLAITAEQGGEVRNIRVYNNLMYNNTITGIHLGAGYQPQTDNIQIFNNSFYNNGVNNDFGASIVLKNRKAQNIQVFNNACDSTVAQISVLTDIGNLVIQNNLFAREQEKWNGEQNGEGYVVGDPLWIDPANGDFRLQSNSPAIGRASPTLVPVTDFRGQIR